MCFCFLLLQTGKSHILTGYGVPISSKESSLTVGPYGPVLLQDVEFLDELAHFDRERIPERVVHAKGAGEFKIICLKSFYTGNCTRRKCELCNMHSLYEELR